MFYEEMWLEIIIRGEFDTTNGYPSTYVRSFQGRHCSGFFGIRTIISNQHKVYYTCRL